jgi:hypothetical protein
MRVCSPVVIGVLIELCKYYTVQGRINISELPTR